MGRAYEVRKASIQKTGARKAKLYSKFGKEIYMIAKNDPNVESNIELKKLVEKAKSNEIPADVIKRAIEKAKGNKDENYEFIRYEGFSISNVTVIVDCLTNNVNRTVSDVRNCFTKTDGKLGVSGSVMHYYKGTSILSFDKQDEDEVLEALIENDCEVEDITIEEDKTILFSDYESLYKMKKAIETKFPNIKFYTEEQTFLPIQYVKLNDEDLETFDKLMNMLDDLEDVSEVYHNVENYEE